MKSKMKLVKYPKNQNKPSAYGKKGGGGKGGGGGGSTYVPKEEPNTLQSNQKARLIDVLSEGEIVGLVNGAQSIYFDDTPLQNSDETFNYQGVSFDERTGLPDQTYISGFPSVENEVSVGIEILQATPIIRTINNPEVDYVRVKIQFPQLTFQDPTNGDLRGTTVHLQLFIQSAGGGYVFITQPEISGKTTSPYEESYRINVKDYGVAPFDIKVLRVEPDSVQSNLQNKTYWTSYTEVTDAKLKYNDTALIGIEVDAKQFGNQIPNRSFLIKGLKIKIPSNYDPETRQYTGIWDGTFEVDYCNNPAWVLFDLLTNERYGLGSKISEDQVDKFALYDIAQYCDVLVDDGKGGQEPRYAFNGVINTREEAIKVLSVVSSVFNGMLFWGSGTIVTTQDSPSDPVKLVSRANVLNGNFDYSGSSQKARHSVAKVSWNDPNDNYRPAIILVEDQIAISRYGYNEIDVVAYGCTSQGQAYRFGKWALDTEQYQTETVTYRASLDHIDVNPGDIINIYDESYASVRYGGRISSVTTDSIVIDTNVNLMVGNNYNLSVVLPDGSIETRVVLNPSGTTNDLIIESPFSQTPESSAMWGLSATNLEPRKFRVISLRYVEDNIIEVLALFHDPNKYARIESDITLPEINYTWFPTGAIKPPTNMTATEYIYKASASPLSAVTISWTASNDSRVMYYEVEVEKPNEDHFDLYKTTQSPSVNVENTFQGEYSFRVRAVDGIGRKSVELEGTYELLGLYAPPSDVENFQIQVVNETTFLSWNTVPDLDLDHYTIKWSPTLDGTATWGSSIPILDQVSKDATQVPIPSLVGTFLIKAVDVVAVESVHEAVLVTNIAELAGYNAVTSSIEEPNFDGIKENCAVVDGILQLAGADSIDDWDNVDEVINWDIGDDGVSMEGTYYFNSPVDVSQVYTSRVTANIEAFGGDMSDNMDLWEDVDAIENWDGTDPSKWKVVLQIRVTNDNPLSSGAVWGEWQDFNIGDYTARGLEFRLQMYSYQSGVSPFVTKLEVTIDMPDRTDSQRNLLISASGTTVSFLRAFKAVPKIAIATTDLSSGDRYTMTSETRTGFTIRFFNSGGTGVDRHINYIADGYGYDQT